MAPTPPDDPPPNKDETDEKEIERQVSAAVKKLIGDQKQNVSGRGFLSVSLQFTPDDRDNNSTDMSAADIPVPTVLRRANGTSSSPGAFALGGTSNRTMQTRSANQTHTAISEQSQSTQDSHLIRATLVIERGDVEESSNPSDGAVWAQAEPLLNNEPLATVSARRKRKMIYYGAWVVITIMFGVLIGLFMLYLDDVGDTPDSTDMGANPPTFSPTIVSGSSASASSLSGLASPPRSPSLPNDILPSFEPSNFPSSSPDLNDSDSSINNPNPTFVPTRFPTFDPSTKPSAYTNAPQSPSPVSYPTTNPTSRPSPAPSRRPTPRPTSKPTSRPTSRPTLQPVHPPSPRPTLRPTPRPTNRTIPSPGPPSPSPGPQSPSPGPPSPGPPSPSPGPPSPTFEGNPGSTNDNDDDDDYETPDFEVNDDSGAAEGESEDR